MGKKQEYAKTRLILFSVQLYKRIIGFCVGISISLIMGVLCAYFLTPSSSWYQELTTPEMNEDFISAMWFFAYLMLALLIGEGLIAKNKGELLSVLFIVILNILWCFIFFRLKDIVIGFTIILLQTLILAESLFSAIKSISFKISALGFLFLWYGYLLFQSFVIILHNYP